MKHSLSPGDDKQMLKARREILSRGYYESLLNGISGAAPEFSGKSPVVLNAGCGEGYYTSGLYNAFCAAGKNAEIYGTDISKYFHFPAGFGYEKSMA